MTKKIRDIRPPKQNSEPKKTESNSNKKPMKKKVNWNKAWILLLIPIILGGLLFFWSFSKAEVQVWPKRAERNLKVTVEIVDKKEGEFEGDLWIDKKIIPGELATSTEEVSGTFESSGTIEEKAKGTVKIYNNYSAQTQTFRAQTRLISDGGKVFRIPERVTIPGKPNDIEVEVVAAEPGEEYNIDPSTFSIPGLSGTALYGQFIGKSFEKMEGGGTFPKVTEQDIRISKRQLTQKAVQKLQERLDSLKILTDGSSISVLEFDTSAEEGEKTEEFRGNLKAEIKGLGFKESNIEEFTRAYILNEISAGEKILPNSLEINYKVKEKNLDEGKISLELDISVETYKDIKEAIIKKGLIGKSSAEAEMFLKTQEDIKDVKVDLWPFWAKQIPENKNKIKVELTLD